MGTFRNLVEQSWGIGNFGNLAGTLQEPSEPCGNLAGTLWGKVVGTLWNKVVGTLWNKTVGTLCERWSKAVGTLGGTLWNKVVGTLQEPCLVGTWREPCGAKLWEPCGTKLREPCGTKLWEPCGNVGAKLWEPWGNLVEQSCGNLGNLAGTLQEPWEPCGNLAGTLELCGNLVGTWGNVLGAAPACSETFTMAEDPKHAAVGEKTRVDGQRLHRPLPLLPSLSHCPSTFTHIHPCNGRAFTRGRAAGSPLVVVRLLLRSGRRQGVPGVHMRVRESNTVSRQSSLSSFSSGIPDLGGFPVASPGTGFETNTSLMSFFVGQILF